MTNQEIFVTKEMMQVLEVPPMYKPRIKASERPKVTGSYDTMEIIRCCYEAEDLCHHEEFKILMFNRSNRLLGVQHLSKGGITGTVTDIRLGLRAALIACATSLVLVHNHPSGNLQPSEADISITKKFKEAASLMDILVMDHIIVDDCAERFFSMADESLI
jgi:DNA repair protein RadC